MTRTAIYSLQDNALTEQPAMESPDRDPDYFGKGTDAYYLYTKLWEKYNAHLATLRTIPAHSSARSLWRDGQKVEEGKDYEVRESEGVPEHYLSSFPNYKFKAFPLPVKSEDGWLTTKPVFTEECILITASQINDKWDYSFFLIEKLDDMEEGWYWGILCPEGEEWGDLADLEAEKYLVIPKLTH